MSGDENDRREAFAEAAAADRVHFSVAPEQWQALRAVFDRPAREIPRLRRLVNEPSVLERKD